MQDQSVVNDDEIDLKELFFSLWRGKVTIMFFCTLALIFGSVHLHRANRQYFVEAIYKPVVEDAKAPNLGGFGGLASLAGISLPSSSSADFTAFQALLTSEEVSDTLVADEELMRLLFTSEWNEDSQSYSQPRTSNIGTVKAILKKILTGDHTKDYMPPNSRRVSEILKNLVAISVDKQTGYLKLVAETDNPELRINIIQRIVSITDELLKTRYVSSAEETLAFYQEKINLARSRELREALAKLMAQENQKLMLAARGKSFVVELLMRPTTSLQPTSPKSSLILTLSIILGAFFGTAWVLIRASLQTRENNKNA